MTHACHDVTALFHSQSLNRSYVRPNPAPRVGCYLPSSLRTCSAWRFRFSHDSTHGSSESSTHENGRDPLASLSLPFDPSALRPPSPMVTVIMSPLRRHCRERSPQLEDGMGLQGRSLRSFDNQTNQGIGCSFAWSGKVHDRPSGPTPG